jgi:hypothetical protein
VFGVPFLSFLGSWKFWVIGLAALAVVSFSYIYVTKTLGKIHDLEHKNALLEVSNKQWEAVAKEQRANAELAGKTLTDLQKDLIDAERTKNAVDSGSDAVLSEKDAARAQVLVDTYEQNVRRCLEIASGSPRTGADEDDPLCPAN